MLEQSQEATQGAEVLSRLAISLNKAVHSSGESMGKAMTSALMVLDLVTGEGSYINAGHNPAYVMNASGKKILISRGSPLGVDANAKFDIKPFSIADGGTLFLYTDGLIENEGPDGKVVNLKRLTRGLDISQPVDSIKNSILSSCQQVWQDYQAEDDCTFLLIKWEKQQKAAA